jgi:drug/metabolite transporter (DMT)-like permease
MNWFAISVACALCTACCDALSKRAMQDSDEWFTGTAVLGIASLLLMPVFFACAEAPFSAELVSLLVITLPLEILAYYLFLSALKSAPISLTLPLLAFTPVLTIATGALIVGESVSVHAAAGISLITAGAYVLNGNLVNQSFFAPVRAIVSNPGSRRMLAVAVLWSITSALGKRGVLMYDPIAFGCIILFGDVAAFSLISLYRACTGPVCPMPNARALGLFALAGTLMAAAEVTHFLAMSMAPAAYMIAVKRLSLVFGVLMGWMFFNERNIRFRLIGASVMVSGIFFLY